MGKTPTRKANNMPHLEEAHDLLERLEGIGAAAGCIDTLYHETLTELTYHLSAAVRELELARTPTPAPNGLHLEVQ